MATTLRQVLDHFERQQAGAIALPALARELGIVQPMLQEMLDYWVRKGRLREVSAAACTTCGSASGCPFVFALPRSYELARDADDEAAPPAAACAHCGCH